MNEKKFILSFLITFLLITVFLFASDLKIVDPEDQTSAPDWGEIYIADDANNIYFLLHNYKPVSSAIDFENLIIWIDADNNPSTGDPNANGADYRIIILGIGPGSYDVDCKRERWNNNYWEHIGYYQESGSPSEINGNQESDGVQTLPTGRTAGVSCGMIEVRFPKSEMIRVPLGSVIAVNISGPDPVGSPTNRFTHTITNNQTRTVDGRISPSTEWVADAIPPSAISNLTALPGTNDGEIILRWTAPGDDGMSGTASSYIVKYATYQITNFLTQGTTYQQNWTPQPAGSAEQKTIVGLTPGTTYYFAIVAVDDAGNRGSWSTSGVNTANFAPAQNLPPPAPTNITFYAADRKISLSWTAPDVVDINHYRVYYDTDGPNPPYTGTGATGGSSPINVGNVTSYILSGLTNFVTYYIAITCVDNTNLESNYSIVISTTPFPRPNTPPSTPAKPAGPSVVAVGSPANFSTYATDPDNDQIRYGWDWDGDGTVDEWSGYYFSGQICSMSHYWNSTGNYQIRVKAQDANGGESSFSEALSITVGTEDLFDDYEDISDWWTYSDNGASISTSSVVGVVGNALRFTFNTNNGWWGVFKMAVNSNPYWNFNDGDWSIYRSFKFYMKGSGSTQIRIAVVEKDATGSQEGEWWVCTLTPSTNWTLYEVTWSSFTRRDWQPNTTFRSTNTLDRDWIRAVQFIQQGTSGSNTIDIDQFYLVKDIDVTPPAAISNLTALPGTNDGEIILRWTAPGDDGMSGRATRYVVKYSLSQISNFNTQGTILSQNWQPNLAGQLEQRIITGLTPGVTYYFAIVAEDDWGNRGTWSTVGVNLQNYAPAQNLVPPPPTTVIAVAGDRTISISWSAVNVVDLKNYKVYYDTDNANPPYTGKGVDQGDSPILLDKSTTSITLTGVIPFTTYYIAITAIDNTNLESSYSAVVATSPYALDWDPPAAITDLVASVGQEHGEVVLRWTATGDDGYNGNITNGKFRIAYSTYTTGLDTFWTTGSWNDPLNKYKFDISTNAIARSRQTYLIKGLQGGVTYYFKVWIIDEAGNSAISNTATSWAQIDLVAPAKITTFSGVAVGDRVIELSWLACSDDGDSSKPLPIGSVYKIQYANSFLAESFWTTYYAQITISTSGVTPSTLVKYKITGLTANVTYYFRIWAADERPNWSEPSNIVAVKALGDVFPPAKITDLTAVNIGVGRYRLSWTSPGDDGYNGDLFGWFAIQATDDISKLGIRKFADVVITTFNVKSGQRVSIELDGLYANKYYFVVWAADEVPNWSDKSNIVCTDGSIYTDQVAPSKVTDLKAVLNLPYYDEAKLTWTATGDNGLVGDFDMCIFRIQYSTVSNIVWDISRAQEVLIYNNLKAGSTIQHYMWVLRRDATYYFGLWVGDGKGNWSDVSNIASVYTPSFFIPPDTTAPAQITDLVSEAVDPDSVLLTWSTPGNDEYEGTLRRGSYYLVQYSTEPNISWGYEFAQIKISTHGVQAGTTVGYLISGLYSGCSYYFRVWCVDQSTNISLGSNIVVSRVIDTVAPAKVRYFDYKITETTGVIELAIVVSGDNGFTSDIYDGKFKIYYSTLSDVEVSVDIAQVEISSNYLKSNSTVWLLISFDEVYGFDKWYNLYIWLGDEAGNYSEVSDTITIFVPLIEKIPPSKVTTLKADVISFDTIKLEWISTGDDGIVGEIINGRYIIKVATYPITEDNFDDIVFQILITTNTSPLSLEGISFKVTTFGTTYYIGLKVSDEQGNYSELSEVCQVYVPIFDVVLPKIEVVKEIPQEVTILRNLVISKVRFIDNREIKSYSLFYRKQGVASWQEAKVRKVYIDTSQMKEVEFEIPYDATSLLGKLEYYYFVTDGINTTTLGSNTTPKILNVSNTTQASFEYGKLTTKDANPYDGDTELILPYGILQKSDIVTIKQDLSLYFAIEYTIEPKRYNLPAPASLKLLYFDLDDDGKEDILGVEEKNLAVYYYDDFKDKYIYIGGKVDTKQNTISVEVYNLGRFVVASKNNQAVINNLDNSLTSKYFITPDNPLIKFSDDVQEITIYSISGKEVYRKKSTNGEMIVWLGKDNLGNFVESGVYICKIRRRTTDKVEYKYLLVSK